VAGGVFHPKSPISSAHDRYCPPTETEVGGCEWSVVGEVDMVVLILGCCDEKIEWRVGYLTPNRRYRPHAISIARPPKPRSGDAKGVWWVRQMW